MNKSIGPSLHQKEHKREGQLKHNGTLKGKREVTIGLHSGIKVKNSIKDMYLNLIGF